MNNNTRTFYTSFLLNKFLRYKSDDNLVKHLAKKIFTILQKTYYNYMKCKYINFIYANICLRMLV